MKIVRHITTVFISAGCGIIIILIIAAVLFKTFLYPAIKKAALPEIQKQSTTTVFEEPPVKPLTILALPASTTVHIEHDPEGRFVSGWRNTGDEIIINGGYFQEDFSPAGFLVVNSKEVVKRMFDQDKSGLIAVKDGVFSIRDLAQEPIQKDEQFDFALQSYPFLIKNSAAALQKDSGKKARRTAVGLDKNDNIYIIFVGSVELSLYEFMVELQQTGISFTHVLNLDGGPSSGLIGVWKSSEYGFDSYAKVSNIIRFQP